MGDAGVGAVDAPLVETKFQRAPLPSNARHRPRLTEALQTSSAPFTLVVAGPGYGKTVAVCEWLDHDPIAVAWLALDPSDDVPAAFWRYVTESIRRVTGGYGTEAIQMLTDEQGTAAVVASLLADLSTRDEPLAIVLDDLHAVSRPDLLAELARFVERLPATVRVVATSRVDPQLPLGRWRAGGRLGELRQDDLRFGLDETQDLLAETGLELDADDVTFLLERTEGWAAGLQLAVLTLRGRDDAHDHLRRSLVGDRMIIDYLVGEVLDALSSDDRDLVLDLSILDDFDGALAMAVTGRPDAARRIRSLESRNLFLLPVDQRGERFRFHQLLRDLLAAELRWRSPDRLAPLHLAAAAHLESTGSLHEAAQHLIAGGEVDRAYQLLTGPAWLLLDQGDMAGARRWLELMPAGLVGDDLDRLSAHLVLLTAAGRVDQADGLVAEADLRLLAGELTTAQEIQHTALRSIIEYMQADAVESRLSALHCIDLIGSDDLQGLVLSRLVGIVVRQAIDDGRLDAAARWLEVVARDRSSSLVVRNLLPGALAAQLALAQGQLDEAERLARRVIDTAQRNQIGFVAPLGEAHVSLAEVLLQRGRLDEAEAQTAIAVELLAEYRVAILEVRSRLVAVAIATARFGPRAGIELLAATRKLFEPRYVGPGAQASLDEAECRLLLDDGDLGAARAVLDRIPPSTTRTLLEARAAVVAREPDEAIRLLDHVDRLPPAAAIEVLLLRARAATGTAALDLVREAADRSIDHQLLHSFLGEGPEVLRLARRAQTDRATSSVGDLLAQVAPTRASINDAGFTESLTERELALLELLPTHLTYREMADEMWVSINTVKTYQKALFRKLGASSRSEAVAVARRANLIQAGR